MAEYTRPATWDDVKKLAKLLNEAGQFSNPDMEKRLKTQAEGFTGFVEKLRGKKLR